MEGDSNILGDLYKNYKDAKEKIRYEALYAVSRGKSSAILLGDHT